MSNPNAVPPEHTKWKKGQSGNPKGKPKGVPHSKTRLRRLLELTENLKNPVTGEVEGFTVAEQMDLAQIIKARKGDTKAYSVILDRLEGKPAQEIKQDLNIVNPVDKILEGFGLKDDGQTSADEKTTSVDNA